ncbi:MAG: hypothetical protein Q8P92_04575 [Candidatus Daviesbacteria bacterium]|nr:hypothetical protein [Candidatus Daviesbacteria bacterium]
MLLKFAKVQGLNTDQKAAQVISSERDSEAFAAVLELISDDAFTKGRQILSEIADFYFEFEGTPAEKLRATSDEAAKLLSQDEYQLIVGSFSGKVLYLIGKGEVEVYLKRAGQRSPLLSVGSEGQLISGFLEESDKVLFATKSMVSFLSDDLDKALDLSIDNFEEEISGKIGSQESESQGLAGVLVEVEVEGEEAAAIPPLAQEEEDLEKVEVKATEGEKIATKVLTKLGGILTIFKKLGRFFPTSGRGRLLLAVILIVIIAIGVGLNYKQAKDQQRDAQFNQLIQSSRDDFEAAKGLKSLNPVEAKTKLDSAKANLQQALSLKPNEGEAKDLQNQINEEEKSILQQFEASEFPVFLDLGLAKEGFQAKQMSLSSGNILLLDPQTKTLLLVDISQKSNEILAGGEQLGDASLAILNNNFAFSFASDKGVIRTDVKSKEQTAVAEADKEWGEIADIGSFGSNAYILDSSPPAGGQIWKYVPVASGYADKSSYLKDDVEADLSDSSRMQIESSIYVLKSNGEILRFTRGNKDNFTYQGLDKGVKDPKSFFTSQDTDNLYVLDSGNSRLLVLAKDGVYRSQIAGNKFSTATDLVVDEVGKKIYLLEGSKIYVVDLQAPEEEQTEEEQ